MEFKNIIGNTEVKDYLSKSIKQNNILHSYLFLGKEGIGKLLIAKEFAKAILCLNEDKNDECTCKSCTCFNGNNNPDFHIINEAGETIKIAEIREVIEKVYEKPIVSNRKVYIINDCDKMTDEAQNCFLKTLEEPPEFITIIMISSNENLILNTIKSRCMTVKFKKINDQQLHDFAINNLGYDNISTNLLKSFDGSIGKAAKLQENKALYDEIEKVISNFDKKDLIDIILDAKIIYDKDNILDILDHITVCLFANAERNEKYVDCIKYVNDCAKKIRTYSNFDMSVDIMIFSIWEELNENSNRC